jgi:demethoxyubiquinone hydroxylase (CLK1/Coq7/Cat5 family)
MQALRLAIKRIPRTPSRAYSTQTKNAARLYSPIVGEEKIRDINDTIVRVDHAGEYGAQRIYDGQIAVLGNASCGNLLKVKYHIAVHLWLSHNWAVRLLILGVSLLKLFSNNHPRTHTDPVVA